MRPPGRLFSLAPPLSPPDLLTLPRRCCRFAGGRCSSPLAASCVPSLAARTRACALFSTSASPVWSASTAASTGAVKRTATAATAVEQSTTTATATATTAAAAQDAANEDGPRLKRSYFLSNGVLARIASLSGASFPSSSSAAAADASSPSSADAAGAAQRTNDALAPHRRRQAARRQAEAGTQAASAAAADNTANTASAAPSEDALPTSSITILSDMAAQQPAASLRRKASALLALTKPRLTVLVVLTAMAPYALYPVPAFLSPELTTAAAAPSLSPLTLLFLTVGTALCSAAANALNMLYEPATDALMTRTRNRPLVRQLLSRRAALAFAAACAVAGVAALQLGVNPTVAFLGAANIALYAGVYTPMKRLSAANTWVGAVVGGIPPLMGWAAAAGETATGGAAAAENSTTKEGPDRPHHSEFRELLFAPDGSSAGGWLLAGLLFAWQFPHFMALSWGVRADYRRAGLRMLCWVNPARNGRVALRYSLAFVPLCVGLCAVGVTEWSFAVTSLPANLWLAREALRFWQCEGHQGTARRLFWASVWHLPAVMVLALLQKKGMWARVYRSVFGVPGADEDDEEDDDDDDALYDDYGDAAWEGVGAEGAEGKPGPVREGEGP